MTLIPSEALSSRSPRAAARRVAPLTLAALATLSFTGCTLWPSTWRLGGSPLDKQQAAAARLTVAQDAALHRAQAAVHQASAALNALPATSISPSPRLPLSASTPNTPTTPTTSVNPSTAATTATPSDPTRPLALARDFVAEARALLDQARGAPTAAEAAQWQDLVTALLSDRADIRARAERERTAAVSETARLAEKLAAATAAAQRANDHALAYARDREDLADFAGKLKLGLFLLFALAALGSVLAVAARLFPGLGALGLASRVIGGVVAPGLAYAAHRAEAGLADVGAGLAQLRQLAGPTAESLIERAIDPAVTDPHHRALISAGATAATPLSRSLNLSLSPQAAPTSTPEPTPTSTSIFPPAPASASEPTTASNPPPPNLSSSPRLPIPASPLPTATAIATSTAAPAATPEPTT